MRYEEYRHWLQEQKYQERTVDVQIYRAKRVEEFYGDLDEHFARDRLSDVINALRYTADDKRHGRPNPSRIPFTGDTQRNLQDYRNAVERYLKFRESSASSRNNTTPDDRIVLAATSEASAEADDLGQRIGLERDMQAALRLEIDQLESGLTIIDDGAERSVDSGFIDITAQDLSGAIVVIELKTGVAGQKAVAQILSYMGDLKLEEPTKVVRGILVAAEFDKRARAAARMVPGLSLRRYGVRFSFSAVEP
jgi:endonuclease